MRWRVALPLLLLLAVPAALAWPSGRGGVVGGAAAPVAVPIGRGARFQPVAAPTAAVRRARPVAGLRCTAGPARRFGVHLELFAAGRVVVVPAGIGVPAPFRRDGAYVRPGGCRYAVSTTEPTGVLEVAHGTRATLGDVFTLWGRPLTQHRLAGFRGPVRAWVGGRPWRGSPAAIALVPHRQVVLVAGPPVPVHPSFTFRAGL